MKSSVSLSKDKINETLVAELEGGTPATYLADVIQAKRIVRLITKVDFSIRENSAEVKDVVLRNREDLIATLPSTRVWLAIKHLRHLVEEDINSPTLSFEITGGKEDAIAGGKPRVYLLKRCHTDRDSESRVQSQFSRSDHVPGFRHRSLPRCPSWLWPCE